MKYLRQYSLFFVVSFVIGLSGMAVYRRFIVKPIEDTSLPVFGQTKVVPSESRGTTSTYSFENSPKNSMTAKVITREGGVSWLSRTASQAAALTNDQLTQGEDILTDKDGKVSFTFPETASVSVSPKTKIKIIQTLPADIVFEQMSGEVKYQRLGETPISVRAKHLLIRIEKGGVEVAIDETTSRISITVKNGSAAVGFNDLKNVTTLQHFYTGDTVVFDDLTRKMQLR